MFTSLENFELLLNIIAKISARIKDFEGLGEKIIKLRLEDYLEDKGLTVLSWTQEKDSDMSLPIKSFWDNFKIVIRKGSWFLVEITGRVKTVWLLVSLEEKRIIKLENAPDTRLYFNIRLSFRLGFESTELRRLFSFIKNYLIHSNTFIIL